MIKVRALFVLIIPLLGFDTYAEDVACIGQGQSGIAGLHPGMPVQVLEGRGLTRSAERIPGEDDGGAYLAGKCVHAEYDVVVVRGVIDSVSTR